MPQLRMPGEEVNLGIFCDMRIDVEVCVCLYYIPHGKRTSVSSPEKKNFKMRRPNIQYVLMSYNNTFATLCRHEFRRSGHIYVLLLLLIIR